MTTWKRHRLLVLAFFVFSLTNAKLEASCCSSAATGGVGRLLPHERALVEISTSSRLVVGSFDNQSHFESGFTDGTPYLAIEPELAAMVRAFDFLLPFVKLPVRVQKSNTRVGTGIADITMGARAPLMREDIVPGFPALSMILSVRLPNGVSMKSTADRHLEAEDITGTGSSLYSISALVEKEIHALNFAAGYGISFEPDYFRQVNLTPGLVHSPLLAIALVPHNGALLTSTWSMIIHGNARMDSRILSDADRRKMTLTLAYSVSLHSHIKLNVQLGGDIPFDYIGKNFNSEAFIRLGLRFGVF